MAKALKCDRCGNFYEVTACNDSIVMFIDYGHQGGTRRVDLCDECYSKLIKWLNATDWVPEGLDLERCR